VTTSAIALRLPAAAGPRVTSVLREHGAVLVLGVLCVAFGLTADGFLSGDNLRVVLQNAALPALLACGVTVGILAGQFDLSVGGIFGFAGVIAALVANEAGIAAAIAAAVLTGAALGAVNGLLTARVGIQSFLVTLATGFIILGLGLVITDGSGAWTVTDYDSFAHLAQGSLGPLQYRCWIVLALFIATAAVLTRTRVGREVYAVGGSLGAARIAGVRTRLVLFTTFIVSGAFAGLAGVVGAADTGVAQSSGGVGSEFTAITAVIVGGTSIMGGRGSVWRTLVGVLLLAVIANGFTLLYVDPTYNSLVQGVIILAAITVEGRLRGRPAT
jgi:ribose/xylose/arabinose/galactoside ABC-type transport system permease subunit